MILWLLAIGVVSVLGQVVLLRELNVAFFGTELIYILAIGFWLLWTATGAALGLRAHVPAGGRVRVLLVLSAWVLPLAVVWIRALRILLGGVPGAYLPFPHQLLGMALSLLPIGLMLGLLFQWSAKIFVGGRRTLAAAYAIESVGGLIGGIVATLFLKWGTQNLTAALLCGLLALVAAVYPPHRDRPRWLVPSVIVTAGLLAVALWQGSRIDDRLTAWNHPQLVASRDSPYGRVTITRASGQLSVFENDALAFESEGTSAEEFVYLAALQRSRPQTVLVLGGGVEGLVEEVLVHQPAAVDYVELNQVLLDLLRPRLPAETRAALDAESVTVSIADPRRFLERESTYDLILVGMPGPDSGQTNRYYTREFFAQCAQRLGNDGVLALRLRGAENLWTPLLARRTASVRRSLRSVFHDVVVLPGVTNIVLASRRPLPRDPEILVGHMEERGVEGELVIPAYVRYLYTNDRFFEIEELLEATQAPLNSDVRPICYQYTMLLWLSRFYLGAATIEVPALDPREFGGKPEAWVVLAVLAVVFVLSRRWPLLRRSILAALAGFIGMVLEIVLILHYQTSRGVLYQDLGLLLTLFMAGLALGSAAIHRRARRSASPSRLTGSWLVGAMVALNLVTASLLGAGLIRGLIETALLLLACGFLVAAVFAYASLHRRPDQRSVISPLYAADLLGGCVGSLVASLILVPLAGLTGTALVMAIIAMLALLLV